uniref:Uncharacterized protein n=1 Tax=Amphimedon queenslandica TaxID=400682 RepID=A0A1X7VKU7_AMPQE
MKDVYACKPPKQATVPLNHLFLMSQLTKGNDSTSCNSGQWQSNSRAKSNPRDSTSSRPPKSSSTNTCEDSLDLCNCDSVIFESRKGVPGVVYDTGEGDSGWIEVKPYRRGRSRDSPCRSDSESSEEGVLDNLPQSAEVTFLPINGTPGLSIRTHRIRTWTPIAKRTRLKTMDLDCKRDST